MIADARTGKAPSKKTRAQAVAILDLCASGRPFAVYTDEATLWLGLKEHGAAHGLACDAVCSISTENERCSWHREDYAEAAQRIREGSL